MAKDKTKDKKKEPKMILEREYIVPLRRKWLKVPKYKRATKAVKALKEFMIRNMKIYDRDLRRIKIDQVLNNELRFRGMRKPPASIKVKAKKFDNETVRVELVNIPEHIKFARLREEKKLKPEKKVKEETSSVSKETENSKDTEKKVEAKENSLKKTLEKKDTIEKKEASKDETLKIAKEQAKEQKHTVKPQNSVEKSFQSKKSQKGR